MSLKEVERIVIEEAQRKAEESMLVTDSIPGSIPHSPPAPFLPAGVTGAVLAELLANYILLDNDNHIWKAIIQGEDYWPETETARRELRNVITAGLSRIAQQHAPVLVVVESPF
jgi:hypothetical protein